MAGKYAHVIDQLPRLLGTEPKYQEKVEAVKKEMLRKPCDCGTPDSLNKLEHAQDCAFQEPVNFVPAIDLAKQYAEVRGELEALEAQTSEANLRLEAISQMLTEQFEVEGVSSLQIVDVGSVRTQYEPYAKVENKEAFRQWCIANGLEQSLALPWQSTNSVTKERLLAGLPEPEGIVAHARVKIVLTRQK